VSTTFGQ